MKRDEQQLERSWREKLEGYEASTDDLGEQFFGEITAGVRRARQRMLWSRWGVGVTTIAAAVLLLLYLLPLGSRQEPAPLTDSEEIVALAQLDAEKRSDSSVGGESPTAPGRVQSELRSSTASVASQSETDEQEQEWIEETMVAPEHQPIDHPTKSIEEESLEESSDGEVEAPMQLAPERPTTLLPPHPNNSDNAFHLKQRRQGWRRATLSLIASNGVPSHEKHHGYGDLFQNISIQESPDIDEEDPYKSVITLANQLHPTQASIRSLPPLRFGLLIAYPLLPQLEVQSGLIYSYVSLESKIGSDEYYYVTEDRRHTIGLPIRLNYHFWQKERVSSYGSLGLLLEKSLYQDGDTKYYMAQKLERQEWLKPEQMTSTPLGVTLRLGLGLRYRISPLLSLSLEPGVSYLFSAPRLTGLDVTAPRLQGDALLSLGFTL